MIPITLLYIIILQKQFKNLHFDVRYLGKELLKNIQEIFVENKAEPVKP